MKSTKTITFSPFTRVEGDLSLSVEIAGGQVRSARASGTMFRGFERLLHGRDPMDALVIMCRICGQCGAAHSGTAARALADAFGAEPPPNGVLSSAIIRAAELLLSHVAHFCFTFAADLCALPGKEHLAERFAPIRGTSFRRALVARRALLGLMGLFAGKWPNTLAIHPGGATRPVTRSELIRCRGLLAEFERFVEESLLGCSIERWLENGSLADLDEWLGQGTHAESDLGLFVRTALDAGLDEMGRGPGRFLSTGAFALPGGRTWLRPGYYDGSVREFDQGKVAEHAAFSWFESAGGPAHPSAGSSVPAPDKPGAYSWAKAPRYAGKSVEVGPMARMLIDGDPLAVDLVERRGASVFSRVLLRLHEVARLVVALRDWLGRIDPESPFHRSYEAAESGTGYAVTEAPRGTLGHWLTIEHGRIKGYQVVTPTSWNLSPRDEQGRPGPLEEALVGTPVRDPAKAVNVALVVRSYDPCLYCSVH